MAYAHTLLPRTRASLPTKALNDDRHVESHAGEYTLFPLLFPDETVLESRVGDAVEAVEDVLFAREPLEFAFEECSEDLVVFVRIFLGFGAVTIGLGCSPSSAGTTDTGVI